MNEWKLHIMSSRQILLGIQWRPKTSINIEFFNLTITIGICKDAEGVALFGYKLEKM